MLVVAELGTILLVLSESMARDEGDDFYPLGSVRNRQFERLIFVVVGGIIAPTSEQGNDL